MPWYCYLAFKQLFPTRRFFSFFSFMSIVGVALGVSVLVIVQSVMNGFGEEIRSTIVSTNGDVRVESDNVMRGWRPLLERLSADSEVQGAAPYAHGVVMLQHGDRPAFPFFRGIDPVREQRVLPLDEFLISGEVDDLDDGSVFLSEGMARSIGARKGATVEVYTPLMIERLEQDEVLLPRELEVAGIFRTGWNEIDANTMIGTLRLMQELYALGDGVHGITVRLREGVAADRFAESLNQSLEPPKEAVSWLESQRDFLFILSMEKWVISFIIIFIVLVASFSIAIALMMTVVRKTREIGLLVAMGGTPRQVAANFCIQGFLIGVTGTILGIGFALLCLNYRNVIIQKFAAWTKSEDAFLRFYQFADLPVHYLASDFILVSVFAVVVSTLAGLLPAWRAARLKPADALRSE